MFRNVLIPERARLATSAFRSMYSDDAGCTRHRRPNRRLVPSPPFPFPSFSSFRDFPRVSPPPRLSLWFRALSRSCARTRELYYSCLTHADRNRARAPSTWPDRQFGGTPISHDDARTLHSAFSLAPAPPPRTDSGRLARLTHVSFVVKRVIYAHSHVTGEYN